MTSAAAPLTQLDALRHFHWIKPQDSIATVVIACMGVATVWASFKMGTSAAILMLMSTLFLYLLWAVSLLFRCSFFVLQLMAYCKTLPDKTARYTQAYMRRRPDEMERLYESEAVDEAYLISGIKMPVLRQLGWVKPFDYVMISIVTASWLTAGVLACTSWETHINWIFALMGQTLLCCAAWCVALTFRCGWFVLQLSADLRTIPLQATRLLVTFERQP